MCTPGWWWASGLRSLAHQQTHMTRPSTELTSPRPKLMKSSLITTWIQKGWNCLVLGTGTPQNSFLRSWLWRIENLDHYCVVWHLNQDHSFVSPREQLAALAKEWDRLGLLFIHDRPAHLHSLIRFFGAFKDSQTHRQIGDQRGQNQQECRVLGPSRDLPSGSNCCELFYDPKTHRVSISISDRRDSYHQIKATEARAISNTIGPVMLIQAGIWSFCLRGMFGVLLHPYFKATMQAWKLQPKHTLRCSKNQGCYNLILGW